MIVSADLLQCYYPYLADMRVLVVDAPYQYNLVVGVEVGVVVRLLSSMIVVQQLPVKELEQH